jgi:hypothetical protein
LLTFVAVLFGSNYSGIDPNQVISVMGTVVTAIAFLITGYFILLAIDAYSHVRDIDKIQRTVESKSNDTLKTCGDTERKLTHMAGAARRAAGDIARMMDEYLSYRIAAASGSGTDVNRLFKERGMVAVRYPFMQSERRQSLLLELLENSTLLRSEELADVREALADETDSKEVKELLRKILKQDPPEELA